MEVYDPEWELFLSDNPDFPADDDKESDCYRCDGPVKLDEWKEYFVKFYGEIPSLFADNAGFHEKRPFSGNIYLIRFKNAVGLTRLGGLNIDINNHKIGNRQFQGMLDYLTDRYPALVADFSRQEKSVGHHYDKGSKVGRDYAYLQLLFLSRFLVTENGIVGLVNAILRDPHRQLRQKVISRPMEAITQPDPLLALAGLSNPQNLACLPASHPLNETPLARTLLERTGKRLFPLGLPTLHRYHCVDTHENRFVKHVMEQVAQQLASIETDNGGYLNPDLSKTLDTLNKQLSTALEDPFWREIGHLRLIPHGSQVLHRKEGYRQFFQLHARLQLLTRQDFQLFDFERLLDTKDSALLYEYWCFLVVKEVVDGLCGPAIDTRLVEGDAEHRDIEEGLRIKYRKAVSLTYNLSCPGPRQRSIGDSYSHTLRPDIVIQCSEALLVLDAKNKINGKRNGDSFGKENDDHTISCAKSDDIDKMHCYRDAITGVIGAFALFPGTIESIYPIADGEPQWQGVGALPLRPQADAEVDPEHRRRLTSIIKDFIHAHAQPIG